MTAIRKSVPGVSLCTLTVGVAKLEAQALDPIFARAGWVLLHAAGERAAMDLLYSHEVHVVIASADDGAPNWRRILDHANRLAPAPPVIVTARLADEFLWAEVLHRGGYDVLAQPFDHDEVWRVVASARRRYQGQPAARVAVGASSAA